METLGIQFLPSLKMLRLLHHFLIHKIHKFYKSKKMNSLFQACQFQGHEGHKVQYVCLDTHCQQKRLFCFKCLQENYHNHGQQTNKNIFNYTELQTFIQSKIDQLQNKVQQGNNSYVQGCIKITNIIKLQIDGLSEILQKLESKQAIKEKISNLQKQSEQIKQTKLSLVDELFISQLINLDFDQMERQMKQQIKEQCDSLLKNSILIQQLSNQEVQVLKLKEVEYEIIPIYKLIDSEIYSATISNDMKYLVSCQDNKIMKIFNFMDQKLIQEYNLNDKAHICKFTDDSRLLYIGTVQGILYCFDFYDNLKQLFKQKIHNNYILNIYCLFNNLVLTSSHDGLIKKTNTLVNKQIFEIDAHEDRIDGLDYNQQEDVIASCSKDNFIKIWNNKNAELLIQEQNTTKSMLSQVLFVNTKSQLISLDCKSNINIWHINYDKKEMALIKSINDTDMVYNISLVLDQLFILSICSEYIKFYSIQGQFVHQIKHDIKDFYMIKGCQLDPLKLILIQGKKELKACKLQM